MIRALVNIVIKLAEVIAEAGQRSILHYHYTLEAEEMLRAVAIVTNH